VGNSPRSECPGDPEIGAPSPACRASSAAGQGQGPFRRAGSLGHAVAWKAANSARLLPVSAGAGQVVVARMQAQKAHRRESRLDGWSRQQGFAGGMHFRKMTLHLPGIEKVNSGFVFASVNLGA